VLLILINIRKLTNLFWAEMDIQSFIFPKQYGLGNAKRWLDKHDAHTDVAVKNNSYSFGSMIHRYINRNHLEL
jgi:hypothetical protein